MGKKIALQCPPKIIEKYMLKLFWSHFLVIDKLPIKKVAKAILQHHLTRSFCITKPIASVPISSSV